MLHGLMECVFNSRPSDRELRTISAISSMFHPNDLNQLHIYANDRGIIAE